MQRESYKNPQIAALLNRDFIPVKVDREINSGLDDALQGFSARLRGAAGWPLNAFVTPEGYPAFAVLYEPPDALRALVVGSGRYPPPGVAGRASGQRAACRRATDGGTQRQSLGAVHGQRMAGG